ncbi:mechanosensitive ion channel family protein [soil metagenome]
MKNWNELIIPLVYFFASLGAGVFVEQIFLKWLIRSSLKTKWKGDDMLLRSLKGIILTWSVIGGLYLAMLNTSFGEPILRIGNNILFSAAVFSFVVLTGRILVGWIQMKSNAAKAFPSTSIVSNIVRITLYVIGFLVILQTFGVSVTPLLTALGVGALAVALALQDTLSNLFSGIQVVASRQIRLGDYVKLTSGEEGYVADITWRNTIITALGNNHIIVPNSKVASTILTNYFLPEKEMSVPVEVSVSYDSDLDSVEAVTIAAAKDVLAKTNGGVKNFEPLIRYKTFGDSAISFSVTLRAEEFGDQFLIRHEFIKHLVKCYRENNIEIPYPYRNIIVKNSPPA